MPDLIAQGTDPADRWRRKLTPGQPVIVGRTSEPWATPWDDRISRRHIEVVLNGDGKLEVSPLPEARNPIFHRGRRMNHFQIALGEHFVIGGTTFTLADDAIAVSLTAPPPDNQRTFEPDELRARPFRRADERIDALSRLPAIIKSSVSDEELFGGLVNVLLAGLPQATGAAVVAVEAAEPSGSIQVLHWDHPRADGQTFAPSERLIRQALAQQASVVHVWSPVTPQSATFTMESGIDWAACVPLSRETAGEWGVYLTGRFDDAALRDPESLQDEVKFAELAAATFRSLREVQRLTRQQGALAQFFSPLVLQHIRGQDPDVVLAPREANVTVLFCDLRGFSLESERLAGRLPELLERVSRSLGVMSRQILEAGGVIGDFHGDSAMGFWGWPLAASDAPLRACRAALAIRREFLSLDWTGRDERSDFRVGIGIATGRAVAGKIGPVEQVKVTVLGPAVNVAARLEALTKTIRAPILIDGQTAAVLRSMNDPAFRVRRVAKVRPAGMVAVVDLHELLPSAEELPEVTAHDLAAYEKAWEACAAGDWKLAVEELSHASPADRVQAFLGRCLSRQGGTPPQNWNGVLEL
jgi:adenylate cyclase